jgi:hypothetical protein
VIDHAVRDGRDPERAISRRVRCVAVRGDGSVENAGWAPHLDLEVLSPEDHEWIADVIASPWPAGDPEALALAYASQQLAPEHFHEVRSRREHYVEQTLQAVHERLTAQIRFWDNRAFQTSLALQAGKPSRLTLDNIRHRLEELTTRLETRTAELNAMRHVVSATPTVVAGALVIPQGLLAERRGEEPPEAGQAASAEVERLAMAAVMAAERAMGCEVIDVSAQKCGWDVTSIPPAEPGRVPTPRHIEVKGRAKGATTVCVTRNEILYALNQADRFLLALVLVDGNAVEGPYYVRHPFTQEPEWAVTSWNLNLAELLRRAERPAPGR